MTKLVSDFFRKDSGAVTVDWVVLCALVISLVVVAITGVTSAVDGATGNFTSFMSSWSF